MSGAFRFSRIRAVAMRDLRQRVAGKGWYKLPALAFALLIPAGTIPVAGPGQGTEAPSTVKIVVAGEIPEALHGHVAAGEKTRFRFTETSPVRLRAPFVPEELRSALERLPGQPRMEVRRVRPPIQLPGRSLFIALLAVSLLTGPLAESLPGERARRTLEVLLSAGISRAELVVGKWAAWTAAATGSAFIASLFGWATGVQTPGPWMLGVLMFIGSAVALGLWLVRNVSDVVGGAAAPMRVIPVVSVGMAVVAWVLLKVDPSVGALVPLGGALLLAGDLVSGPGPVVAAAAGTVATTGALLAWTTRDLGRWEGEESRLKRSGIGLVAFAGMGYWLAVAGPGVWRIAGNDRVELSDSTSVAAGGLVLLLTALAGAARNGRALASFRLTGMPAAALAGAALALMDTVDLTPNVAGWLVPLQAELGAALVPSGAGIPAATALIVGAAWLFRDFVQREMGLGVIAGAVAWTAIVAPLDPVRGLTSGLLFGALATRYGPASAAAAHVVWTLAAWAHVFG